MITARLLDGIGGIRHGFFTREGGASGGIYASLNTGLGSDDDRATVLRNRATVSDSLGASALVTPYQYHSAVAVIVDEPWTHDDPPKADASVTNRPGVAVAINTADCTPVLFATKKGDIVGAAHAGWKGAVGGVLQSTVERMVELGAEREDIVAAIGPTISRASYEVGPEFHDRFISEDADNARFFDRSRRDGHFMFDLPGYVAAALKAMELGAVEDVGVCTYADERRFFSYRRTTHRSEPDYGRQLSAIMIA
jgi:YfiH family protein